MNFRRLEPTWAAKHWVESYWIIESVDNAILDQKIIPDGYPEMIFHFADQYCINISGSWENQTFSLLAGQIKQHFYLRNTGRVSILGVKLQPHTLAQLFQFEMSSITDKVVPLDSVGIESLNGLEIEVRASHKMDERLTIVNRFFEPFPFVGLPIKKAIDSILETKGNVTVEQLCQMMDMSERQTERHFQKFVGLSPKFYCRIIRFNAIFQLLSQRDPSWAELAYEAGFADQSHFIRNFKAFTGEGPSDYGFDEKTLANFFLKKG
jgi:AraC-like DNA-binding protein